MRVMMVAAALALGTAPALAQDKAADNMVSVTVPDADVLGDFVSDSESASLSLPVVVHVPVGIAANACGVDASDLAKKLRDGPTSCTAMTGSKSLAQQVLKEAEKPQE